MSDADRQVNRELAEKLFRNVMGGKPGRTLDIGAKLPVFAAALHDLGCEAWALDHVRVEHDLPVHTWIDDFEYGDWGPEHLFDFISLIHTFEHFYDPVKAIQKLRSLVSESGRAFIRMPDHSVSGYERDLTTGHYAIHPFYHSLSSLLQALYETKTTFIIEESWILDGVGQRDIVLRPIEKAPIVALGMIVKNEERDLPRVLKSVEKAVDKAIIIDTGSTDRTMEVATAGPLPVRVRRYTEASRKDASGDWKLEDFSEARNVYLREANNADTDWVLSLDADDELMTPDAIRRASYWKQLDGFAVWIQDGGSRWVTHRMWKPQMGVKFEGRAHEYPNLMNMKCGQLDGCLIVHHGDPNPTQEDSNVRNLRILMLDWDERPNARTAFYIANTHRDAQRWKEASEWYSRRIGMGEHYKDEWLFAHLYGGRAMWRAGEKDMARRCLREGRYAAPDWMEFSLELARFAYEEKDYQKAIELATPCVRAPIPMTNLWREPSAYSDQPARLISWCHEHLGNLGQALAWSETAAELIGGPDKDWSDRHQRLRTALMTTTTKHKPVILLSRPGAIGDILMTLNLVPELKSIYPDHEIVYACAAEYGKDEALGNIIRAAGCDSVIKNGEIVATYDPKGCRQFNLIGYPIAHGYPEKPMLEHLLNYFRREVGIATVDFYERKPLGLPTLSLPKPPAPLRTGRYCTIQRRAGWSKFKEWPDAKWDELLRELNRAGIPVLEIDEKHGLPLSTVIALFANASMHIGIDSFCNHLSHYLWDGKRVPAIILWGSTQWDAAGYPENTNISKGLACQPCFRETHPNSLHPRGPCINVAPSGVHSCMDAISVEEVLQAAMKLWTTVPEACPA